MTTKPPSVDVAGAAQVDDLVPGVAVAISPLVRRVLAPNPSVMTGPGTNTYLVGSRDVTVIDPGPDDPAHVQAILDAAHGNLERIICTHTHIDHWPATNALVRATGAQVLAYGSRDGLEVTDTVADGDEITTSEYTLEIVHTPGHAANHVCVLVAGEQLLFSGDHIMEGVTVVIAPLDGDMGAYMASLKRLAEREPPLARIAPAHGHVLEDPAAVIAAYLAHRKAREDLVVAGLGTVGAPTSVDGLVPVVYADVDAALYPIARLSLWAHLRKLVDDGRVDVHGERDDIESARWSLR